LCEVAIPVNALARKMGAGRGFDAERVAQAERSVASVADEFLRQTAGDLERLADLLGQARAALARGQVPVAPLDAMRWIAHDLRGLSGTFDYPLAGQVANGLHALLARYRDPDDVCVALAELHVGALRALFAADARGAGDAASRQLLAGLDAAVRKRAPQAAN